jgi:hypothetical protein
MMMNVCVCMEHLWTSDASSDFRRKNEVEMHNGCLVASDKQSSGFSILTPF